MSGKDKGCGSTSICLAFSGLSVLSPAPQEKKEGRDEEKKKKGKTKNRQKSIHLYIWQVIRKHQKT